jgi:hypothetical protein
MIALDLATFHQSSQNGNMTGVIYVELESGAFPAKGWSDFPVIILGWWTEALLQFEVPTRSEVRWRFMDGPHSLTLTKVEGAICDGALVFDQVQSCLCQAAEHVISYCDQHKLSGKDLETLRTNVRPLKAANCSFQILIRPSGY